MGFDWHVNKAWIHSTGDLHSSRYPETAYETGVMQVNEPFEMVLTG